MLEPENRRLTEDEKEVARQFHRVGADKKRIRQHMLDQYGKVLTRHDLNNVLRVPKNGQPDLEAAISILSERGFASTVVEDAGTVCGLFFQDQEMRSAYEKFPDLLLMDSTYKLLDIRTPVWLTDKDRAEKAAIKDVFPDCDQFLCSFHVLQSFRRELNLASVEKGERERILGVLQQLVFANDRHLVDSKDMAALKAVSKASFMLEPENRRLTEDEKEVARQFHRVGADKKRIRQHMLDQYGKVLTRHDLNNVLRVPKNGQPDLEAAISILSERGFASTVVEDAGTVCGLFFQDQEMRSAYEKFPDLLLMDSTYKLLDIRTPVFTILTVDSFGRGVPLAVFLVTNETAHMIGAMLRVFREHNTAAASITKVWLTDKDRAEKAAIKDVFPDCDQFLCSFHVLQSFRRELNLASVEKGERERILGVLQQLVFARKPPRTERERYRQLLNVTSQIASVGCELTGAEHRQLLDKLTTMLHFLQQRRSFLIVEEVDGVPTNDSDLPTDAPPSDVADADLTDLHSPTADPGAGELVDLKATGRP
ncbi:Protein FAR1-RELATED SEQUENCE 5 [Amphibalanus amphitrite]|uniref:Protein FAR1-RELATED SEQUENCE 5 n=1 Tax=Amphibalanus amphitrite TaxID=1232801 RepID=A0A6A4V3F3_AMPAM|nr:Protein FAR1-RELATED SEQUENCE 5 [Amphibalanus amphitrite]